MVRKFQFKRIAIILKIWKDKRRRKESPGVRKAKQGHTENAYTKQKRITNLHGALNSRRLGCSKKNY